MEKDLFREKYVPVVATVSMLFVLILLLFNSISFIKDMNKIFIQEHGITGFATDEYNGTMNQSESSNERIYSMKSYAIFYFSLMGLVFVIIILSLVLIIPRVKKYT